uniref:Collagen alpha-1(III) chain-like n=1 Tax=Castor canadensis TaxID=51338 RepID=A0A8B7TZY8_CASCN|nr:collagen alpha-1(III) chain-like [Castor canadensis]
MGRLHGGVSGGVGASQRLWSPQPRQSQAELRTGQRLGQLLVPRAFQLGGSVSAGPGRPGGGEKEEREERGGSGAAERPPPPPPPPPPPASLGRAGRRAGRLRRRPERARRGPWRATSRSGPGLKPQPVEPIAVGAGSGGGGDGDGGGSGMAGLMGRPAPTPAPVPLPAGTSYLSVQIRNFRMKFAGWTPAGRTGRQQGHRGDGALPGKGKGVPSVPHPILGPQRPLSPLHPGSPGVSHAARPREHGSPRGCCPAGDLPALQSQATVRPLLGPLLHLSSAQLHSAAHPFSSLAASKSPKKVWVSFRV